MKYSIMPYISQILWNFSLVVIKNRVKIDCEITFKSHEVINKKMKYLENLKKINLTCKNENKLVNIVGDEGYKVHHKFRGVGFRM